MRRLLLLAGAIVLINGCTSESSLPNPSGKGAVRAINAIKGSPDVGFRIEETLLGTLVYKQSSPSRRWDDFEYTFNFDVLFFGESQARRVARPDLKVEPDRDYTLVLTGDIAAPSVRIWDAPERSFADNATVFELRLAHAAASLGDIDVYFASPGTAPAPGGERGRLSPGDALGALDFEAGDYVLTVTSAGDSTDILYQSATVSYSALSTYLVPVFDGDELDNAPVVASRIVTTGGATPLADARFPPTVRFFQASSDMPPANVFDDEMLTSQVLADHEFGDITGDIDVAIGNTIFTYAAVGNDSAVLFEGAITAARGVHYNFVVTGLEGSRSAVTYIPDRRSLPGALRLNIFAAALNHATLDLYAVDVGQPIDDAVRRAVLPYATQLGSLLIDPGSYDLYLTRVDEKTIVAGPTRIDADSGDVVEIAVFDTTDPATAEIRIVPAP